MWLRNLLGAREIVLVGFRLGATLAAEAGGVERLIQIAPVVNGLSYARELSTFSRMLFDRQMPSGSAFNKDSPIDLEGYILSGHDIEQLKQINILQLANRPAEHVLVLPGASGRTSAYIEHLRKLGCSTEVASFLNLAALSPNSIPEPPPIADFDRLVEWAKTGMATRKERIAPRATSGLIGPSYRETGVRFGENKRLAGVVCEPLTKSVLATVIFLNTGGVPHTGPGRSFVEIARELACYGIASLRMDLYGLGNSDCHQDGPRSTLYSEERHVDVSAALDMLCSRGLHSFTLVGVCSGASLALWSANKDQRVEEIILVNILVFNPEPRKVIEQLLDASAGRTSSYLFKAIKKRYWARVIGGEVPLRKLAAIVKVIVRRRIGAIGAMGARTVGRLFPFRSSKRNAALSLLETPCRRGARILFLYGDQDPGLEVFSSQFGLFGTLIQQIPSIAFTTAGGVDHSFSNPQAKRELIQRIMFFVRNSSVQSIPAKSEITPYSLSWRSSAS